MKSSKLQKLALAVLPFLAISTATADTNQVYLENGGYVLFQVEDAQPTNAWRLYNEIEGYTGEGYFEWTGPNNFTQNTTGNGTITYHFRVETAGNYELLLRSRIAKGDNNTEANDTWVRLSTGTDIDDEEPLDGWFKVYMNQPEAWTWSSRTGVHESRRVRQHFTAGDHTLEISGRSYGHAIDKIGLYRYPDVNFNPLLNDTLALSNYMQLDGSVINPNTSEEQEPAPEPEPELQALVNAESISSELDVLSAAVCVANTLTLPVSNYALLDTAEGSLASDINELLLTADASTLLLSYDLSLLPAISDAQLHYTTGSEISNGALSVYLGSHDDWSGEHAIGFPSVSVNVATAAGGWEAETTYSTNLDASLLPRSGTTLMLSLSTDSDDLSFGNSTVLPRLTLSGDDSFCSNWEANVLESNQVSANTDAPGIDPTAVDPTAIDPSTVELLPPPANGNSSAGGTGIWFVVLLISGLARKLKAVNKLYRL